MPRKMVSSFEDDRARWAITPDALARLHEALPADWELVRVRAKVSSRGDGGTVSDEARAAIQGAEVYLGFGFPRELFLAARQGDFALRWVHTGSAGVGNLLYPEMVQSDVVITNSAGIHAEPMAETVIGAALHFARGFDFAVRSQAHAQWDQSHFSGTDSNVFELAGSTLGIVGFGGVGREVARRAHALGMRVMAVRRHAPQPHPHAEILSGDAQGLNRLLRESDFLVIAVPSTAHTRHLIGFAQLALMKQHAVVINVARGDIIDEAALIDALREDRLRGAALDVFEHEPLPPDSPLWHLPNVLVLPHISGTTSRFWEREMRLIVENFQRYLRAAPMLNVVDKREGY